MNSHSGVTPNNEQLEAWLDQLADGEMSGPQRRELLASLDQVPHGWRRCALAFLESQAWREALGQFGIRNSDCGMPVLEHDGRSPHQVREQLATKVIDPTWYSAFRIPHSALAAAACFIVAFGLGLLVHRTWLTPRGASSLAGGGPPGSSFPPSSLSSNETPQGRSGEDKWGTVQFVVDGPGGSPQEVQVPAVDGPEPDEFIRNQPPLLPPEIERELRRLGHRVETQRHLLPVPLDDGRRVLIPLQRIEVRPIGGRGYQ